MRDIPNFDTFVKVKPIHKGGSGDKKYYVETKEGARLLLRVSDISAYGTKQFEGDELIISHLQTQLHCIGERPTALMHEDFQTDNMVISPDSELYTIGFQMCFMADPYLVMTGAGVSAMYISLWGR